MTIRLKVFEGDHLVATHVIDGDLVKIGRLANSHVQLDDEQISRMHAVIESAKGVVSIIDLGSSQGTLVNGQRVNKAVLKPGDEIRIGGFRLEVGDPATMDELEDIGARLSAVRGEATALVARGRGEEAVQLVRRRAGLGQEEAKAYVASLLGK